MFPIRAAARAAYIRTNGLALRSAPFTQRRRDIGRYCGQGHQGVRASVPIQPAGILQAEGEAA